MEPIKRHLLVIPALFVAVAAVACSGSDSTESATTTAPPATAAPAGTAATSSDDPCGDVSTSEGREAIVASLTDVYLEARNFGELPAGETMAFISCSEDGAELARYLPPGSEVDETLVPFVLKDGEWAFGSGELSPEQVCSDGNRYKVSDSALLAFDC